MEGGVTTEQDYDEFEMLLGEIPNAMSGNHQSEHPGPTNPSPAAEPISQEHKEGKSSPPRPFANTYHSSLAAKQGGDMTFYSSLNFANSPFDHELQSNGKLDDEKCDYVCANQYDLNLPDDCSLTSVFEKLSFKDGVPTEPIDSVDMSIPPLSNSLNGADLARPTIEPYPPFTSTNRIDKFNVEVTNQANIYKLSVHEMKQKPESLSGGFGDPRQSLPMYPGTMHLAQGMNTFQFVSGLPVPGVEFPPSTFHQQYYLDTQPPRYMQPQHLSRSHITWRNIEEDRYRRMHQQYFYLQQLHNQGPEVHPLQKCNNAAMGSLMGSPIQPYFGMPISHQIEQTNQDPYWNNSAVPRGLNQLDLASMGNGACRYYNQGFNGKGENCAFAHGQKQTAVSGLAYSGKDFKGVPVLNKVGKHFFPEKILTRSQGLNSLRTLKSGSTTSNESLNHANYSRRGLSNGHFHPPVPSTTSFQLDGRESDGSYPVHFDFRHISRSVQQKYSSVDEVLGRIYFMAKDQHGCRFLQRKFTDGTPEDVEKIFVEIIGHIVELMTDPFGNYLIQKLLDVCNEKQRMYIICEITSKEGELIRISRDMHGTRAVQKVIESLKTPEEFSMIVSSLEPGIVPLIKDTNGNHVAQHCLQYLLPEFNEFLFDAAITHCVELARDRQGCCVLQKCLSHSDGDQKHRLMSEITSNALVLSQDPFGNYVVQYILDQKVSWATENVVNQLEGNFGYLSMQKYGSNVVEKCLKFGGDDLRIGIIQELISNPQLVQILQDPFGNYVIQSAVKSCKGPLHAAFVEAIRPHFPALRSNPYGKKVLSSINMKK